MNRFDEGLRCQDVHSGLRNLDPNSPVLAPLNDTRIVGMTATLAGLIRGRDVISDAQALMQVAAQQLDVQLLAFTEVIGLLEEAGYVEGVRRSGGRITAFNETIPLYDDLYETLGSVWRGRQPTELEQQVVLLVDGLSQRPAPLESLSEIFGLDASEAPTILEVGRRAGLVQTIRTMDGDIAFSPFFGFENPAAVENLVLDHGSGRLIEEFRAVRAHQGLELVPGSFPLLTQAVASGLLVAPSVRLPSGKFRAFAALPYAADRHLLSARKPVLEKALAVLACLRTAERYGEYNTLSPSALVNVINKLLDRNRGFLNPNSAHRRQYELMRNAGIVVFAPDTRAGGNWVTPTFIDTSDNREALTCARDLLQHGELMETRIDDVLARQALEAGGSYTAPMQTVHRMRPAAGLSPEDFGQVMERALGLSAL